MTKERRSEIYLSLNPKRFEDETFNEYKIRRRYTTLIIKEYLKGKKKNGEHNQESTKGASEI